MNKRDLVYRILKKSLGNSVSKKELGIYLFLSQIFIKTFLLGEYNFKFYIISLLNNIVLELNILEDYEESWDFTIQECLESDDPKLTIFITSYNSELRNINEFKLNRKFLKL